jgi:predicted Zn-dependent protease
MKTLLRSMLGVASMASLLAVHGCATNPVTGQKQLAVISEAQEIQIGQQAAAEFQQAIGIYDDPQLQRYVTDIGMRLAQRSERPGLPWKFAVADTPSVNAMALPGGPIYVTRGMLAHLNDEAELAGVMGHEVGHVTARHAVQQASRGTVAQLGLVLASVFFPETAPYADAAGTGLSLLFLKHGRDAERESDRLGARYAALNGWDPDGVVDMLRTLSRISEGEDRKGVPSWLSTHPEPGERVAEMAPIVAEMRQVQGRDLTRDRDQFLARVQGVMFGDNPREGVIRGNAFLHPELRFGLEFPEGWVIANGPSQVVAQDRGGRSAMILQLLPQAQGRSLGDVAQASMGQAGFQFRGGERAEVSGLDAFVGTWEGNVQGLGRAGARAAVIAKDGRVYRLIGISGADVFNQAARVFDRSIASFRALSGGEAGSITPARIALHRVRQGDTWGGLAEGTSVDARALAVMNGFAPGDPVPVGQQVKVVREGE